MEVEVGDVKKWREGPELHVFMIVNITQLKMGRPKRNNL
jgi:hypothetical protein